MPSPTANMPTQMAEGFLEAVDLLNRCVTVRQDDSAWTYDVPTSCEVLLNGERVKLRLLQPRDRVSVTYCRRQGVPTALSLEISTRL